MKLSPLAGFASALAAGFLLTQNFPPRAGAAENPPAAASPAPAAWLGDPGVDVEQARTKSRERQEAADRYEVDSLLAAYERSGSKDPRWDEAVRACLQQTGATNDLSPIVARKAAALEHAACKQALQNGCNDPFVVWLGLRSGLYRADAQWDELARVYTAAELRMFESGYPTYWKFFAAARTVQKDISRRLAVDGTTGRQGSGYSLPAKKWPDGVDVKTAFQHTVTHLLTLLQDPAVSLTLYYKVYDDFLDDATSDPIGRAEALVPLAKFFESDPLKGHPTYALKAAEGAFWITYAWDARRGGYATTVTQEGWQLFGERLEKAAAAFEAAWKLDPGGIEAPANMITVMMGLGADRDQMEKWFRRAMDAKPNDFESGTRKLTFLEPKWGGSVEDMMEFARQCAATRDWLSRMPFLMLTTHYRLAQYEKQPVAYWKRPGAWPEVREVYDGYLAEDPDSTRDQTACAIYASYAEDWPTVRRQFERLHGQIDAEAIRTMETPPHWLEDTRKALAEHPDETKGR